MTFKITYQSPPAQTASGIQLSTSMVQGPATVEADGFNIAGDGVIVFHKDGHSIALVSNVAHITQ